jgi:hypothetical protein
MVLSDLQSIYESIITSLIKQDYAVVDHFFDDSILKGLNDQILLQIEVDNLRLAGIGTRSDFDKNNDIRRDKIKWISNTSTVEAEQKFLPPKTIFLLILIKPVMQEYVDKSFIMRVTK